jgi:hypothetical protein
MPSANEKISGRKKVMELNQQDIDILDRYFRNELTPEELVQLHLRLKENEFGGAANSYLQTLKVVEEIGRNELRSTLTAVQLNVESKGGYEKYKSSKSGSSASGAFTFSIILLIAGIIAWFYFSGNFDPHKLHEFIPESENLDTVYHYNIKRDTVYRMDTVKKKSIRRVVTDTVYIRSSGNEKELKQKIDSVVNRRKELH